MFSFTASSSNKLFSRPAYIGFQIDIFLGVSSIVLVKDVGFFYLIAMPTVDGPSIL